MKDAFEKLFRAVHQFKKLNVSDLIPGLSSSEFSVMGAILQMGENGKITGRRCSPSGYNSLSAMLWSP